MTAGCRLSRTDVEQFFRALADDNVDTVWMYFMRYEYVKLDEQFCKQYNASIVQTACQHDSRHSLEKILSNYQYKSLIEFRDFENKTALHHCATFNSLNCAGILLENGANVCALKRGDTTPLMCAAHKDHYEMFVLLMKYHSKHDVCDSNGWNCGHIAAKVGAISILKDLFTVFEGSKSDSAFWNARTKNGSNMLHIAAHNGQHEVVRLLLNNPNGIFLPENKFALDCEGKTPFLRSIICDDIELSAMLYDGDKIDVNAEDAVGRTALHLAASINAVKVAKLLCDQYSADPDHSDK